MARIRLIRHGEAAAAWGGADADPGLSDAGRAQAAAVARGLAGESPARIVTSPLRRCRETAAPLAERLGLEPLVAPEVAEVPTPPALPPEARGAWLRAAFASTWAQAPGGDYPAWRDAVADFVAGLEDGAAVFTHFVAINAAVSVAMDDPRMVVFRPGNASVTTLESGGGRLRVITLGAQAESRVL